MSAAILPFPSRASADVAPVVIGLAGPIGCGKSTVAKMLEVDHGFARTRFAAPLKSMMRVLLLQAGYLDESIERMIEGDLKEQPCDALLGRTPRHAMQALGTEWGRDLISPALWTNIWAMGVNALIAGGHRRIVVEDVRFANEAEAVRALGGRVVYIDRPEAEAARALGKHPSERFDFETDQTLVNAQEIDDLSSTCTDLVRILARATLAQLGQR